MSEIIIFLAIFCETVFIDYMQYGRLAFVQNCDVWLFFLDKSVPLSRSECRVPLPVLMAIRYKIIIGKLSEIGDERAVERSQNASIIGCHDRCRGQLVLLGLRRALQFITHPAYAHKYIHTYNSDRRYYTITCWGVFRFGTKPTRRSYQSIHTSKCYVCITSH